VKILHVVQGYPPAVGGTENLFHHISERLVQQYGDEVTVFTANGYNAEAFYSPRQPLLPPGRETINGVRVRRFRVLNWLGPVLRYAQQGAYWLRLPFNQYLRTLYGGPILPGLKQAIGDFDGDVVVASSFPLMHMYTALAASRINRRPLIYCGGLHPQDRWGFDRPMIYDAIRRADAYIAFTTYERDFLWQKGVPAKKLHVVGLGVDAERFASADGTTFRQRWGDPAAPVVAFIGQQARHKGVDTLVRAMEQVWQRLPKTRLLIAGARTRFSPALRRQIEALPPNHREQVLILDNFDEAEKPSLVAACDLLAYPSEFESFGLVYVEAWACGKPVIGSHAGAIPSVVQDGTDGLLVPPRDVPDLTDALTRLLEDESLRHRLGEHGRQKVLERYTWETVVARFRQVYERAVEQNRSHLDTRKPLGVAP
jgi:glycosyltransferase involved in cell wall biosynthesis